jgi:hypothetical protein
MLKIHSGGLREQSSLYASKIDPDASVPDRPKRCRVVRAELEPQTELGPGG